MRSRIHGVFGAVVTSLLVFLVSLLSAGILVPQAPDRAVGLGQVSAEATNNFDQIVIVAMENHNQADIYGHAAYLTSLADQFGFAQHWRSLVNPSQENYIGVISGSTWGLSGDGNHPNLNHPTIVDIIENSGHTWKAIAENAGGSGCGTHPPRGEDHFPFLSFTTITGNAARCTNLAPGGPSDVLSAFNAGTNFIWLTPTDNHNMHDNSVSSGDAWIASWVPQLLSAMAGKRAVFMVWFDEAYSNPPYIYLSFSGTAVKPAYKSTVEYSHYSLLKLIEDVWGGGNLGQGDVTANSPVEFFLPGGPDFSLTANPTNVAFASGGSATSTITLTSTGGFTGTVDLTAVSVPAGVTTSCAPSSLSGNATSTCTLSGTTPGSFTVTISGTSGSTVHTATIDVTVSRPDFSLTANPNSVSFAVNESATSTITLQPTGGFSGTVSLSATSAPSGVSVACIPTNLVGNQRSTCTLSAADVGSYGVTITGTDGSLSHTAFIDVTVTSVPQPDFSLLADPSAVSFVAVESAQSRIRLQSTGGFAGTVDLSTDSAPAGVTITCDPSSLTAGETSTCTFSSPDVGSYLVTITGTSGPLVHDASISVVVSSEPPPDTVPPEIAISSPSNASVVPFATVTVQGNASDNVAIQSVELSTDNISWIPTNGTASWSANVTVDAGTTTIYARATDTAGNQKTVRIEVFVESLGGIPPPPADGSPFVVDRAIPLHLMAILLGVAGAAEAILYFWTRRNQDEPIPAKKPEDPTLPPPPGPDSSSSLGRLLR